MQARASSADLRIDISYLKATPITIFTLLAPRLFIRMKGSGRLTGRHNEYLLYIHVGSVGGEGQFAEWRWKSGLRL